MFKALDYTALGVAVAVFAIGLLIAWLLRRFSIADGISFVTLVLLPLVAYGIASGYVSEITGPGGWGAKFREVAQDRVEPAPLANEIEDLRLIEKAGVRALEEHRKNLVPGRPIGLTLELGRAGYYSERVIADYVRAFLTFDPQLTVVFVDDRGRFVGSSNGNSVLAALELERGGGERRLVPAMEKADLLTLKELLVLTTNFVTRETTNAEALQMMLGDGVESMVAVNDERRPVGLVRRDAIVSRLMVKLAAG